ncbi:MAG: hypothetical protein DMF70_09790 [Acidobacteria bacterium]|nr:MAG: hypothetical protein DMF70_09790 [Acidobacteriota bacterium]
MRLLLLKYRRNSVSELPRAGIADKSNPDLHSLLKKDAANDRTSISLHLSQHNKQNFPHNLSSFFVRETS